MNKLSGQSALITGASQGLGKQIAQHFVAAGASVVLLARQEHLLTQAVESLETFKVGPKQKVLALVADVSDSRAVDESVSAAIAQLGRIDILVNNAAIQGTIGRFDEVDWNEWVRVIQVNLLGTALLCRAVIPVMKAQGSGKIINLSGGGATGPRPRFSAYAASKAAVVRLTETLATELEEFKIDVNAIAPGTLNTQMLEEVLSAGPERAGEAHYRSALQQRAEGGTSMKTAAELTVFLGSTDSDGITGRLISAVRDDCRNFPEYRERIQRSDVFTLRRIVPGDRGWESES